MLLYILLNTEQGAFIGGCFYGEYLSQLQLPSRGQAANIPCKNSNSFRADWFHDLPRSQAGREPQNMFLYFNLLNQLKPKKKIKVTSNASCSFPLGHRFLISRIGQLELINGSTTLFPSLFVFGRTKYLCVPGAKDPGSLCTLC